MWRHQSLWRPLLHDGEKLVKTDRFLIKQSDFQLTQKLVKWQCFTFMPCPFKVPKCFGLVQIFCVRPKIYLNIVPVTNILCQSQTFCARQKDDLHSVIFFCVGTKVFEEALNAVKFLG